MSEIQLSQSINITNSDQMSWTTPQINNHVMSFGFFLIFAAYNVVQNFATTLDPSLGSLSLGILFIVWIFASLTFATSLVNVLTSKYAMIVGTITYTLYSLSTINIITPIYISASVLIGIGASIVWIGQSKFTTKSANEHEMLLNKPMDSFLGTFNGIFGIYLNFSIFIGQLIAGFIFQFGGSITILYIVMSIMSFIGSMLLLCIKATKNDYNDIKSKSICDEMREIFSLYRDKKLWILIPMTVHWGLQDAFISADYPAAIDDNAFKFYMLTIYGFVASIVSVISGKLSDIYKSTTIMLILFGEVTFVGVVVIFYFWNMNQEQYIVWIILAILNGIGMGIYWTLIPKIYPIIFNSKNNTIFSNQKMLKAIGSFIGFFYFGYTSFNTRLIVNFSFTIISTILILCNPIKTILLGNNNITIHHTLSSEQQQPNTSEMTKELVKQYQSV